jgi:SAM-dependent methyltransferase
MKTNSDAFASNLQTALVALEYGIESMLMTHEEREAHQNKGHYRYIPLDASAFQDALELVELINSHIDPKCKLNRKTFIDVGCGIGAKLVLAKRFFGSVRGVEIVEKYADFARAACERQFGRVPDIETIDGRKYRRYNEVDVIYMYSPMMSHELQIELELAAYRGARDGTIFIEALKKNHDQQLEPRLQLITRVPVPIYLKTRSKKLVADLQFQLRAAGITI